MTADPKPYNPLDYENLTANCVRELMTRGPEPLPLSKPFRGAGVYALFYQGTFALYEPVRSMSADQPIYVGKAVPAGGRKGIPDPSLAPGTVLYGRLGQHARSIDQALNLELADFVCRYLVVEPLWISMAERFLIQHYQPLWNVRLDGFGNHNPGSGREQGEITWWDALHPGRPWASRLRQTRTVADAENWVEQYLRASDIERARIVTEALRERRAED